MTDKPTYEELEQKIQELNKTVFEHQRVEKILNEREERFRLMFDRTPLGYQSLDENGNIIEINQAWLDTLGYTREEVIGKNFSAFLHPDWADHFKKNFPRFNFMGEVLGVEFKMIKKEGSYILTSITGKIGGDKSDNCKKTHCILYNISQQRGIEEALRSERQRAQTYLDLAGVIFVALDTSHKITLVNRKACEVLGYAEEELIGKNWFDTCLPPRLRETVKEVSKNLLLGQMETSEYYENPVLTKKGEERLIAWHNTVLRDGEGKNIGLLSSGEDITDRKRAEDALRESEQLFKAAFESANDCILIWDNNYNYLYANQAALDHVGITRDQVRGKNIRDALAHLPNFMNLWMNRIDHVFKTGTVMKVTDQTEIEGKLIHTHSIISPVINERGETVSVCVVYRDITDLKKVEEENLRLEEQLRQSQKIESLGTLAGGIAHEFNNILGIIIGNTELAISNVSQQDKIQNNLEEIRIASLRARDVVRQLLTFSCKTEEEFKTLHFTPILLESLRLIRSSIPASIEIRQNNTAKADILNADPTQINQIMINLCTNAAHAMQEKGGIMEIILDNLDITRDDPANHHNLSVGTYLRLTVKDSGCGMTRETIERIFDPFFTTKEVGQGSGMGLSVVQGIVKDHGGHIKVKSKPGKGTMFQVFFPIVDGILEPEMKTGEQTPCGTERILFVDDEQSIVLAAKQNLEELNYTVIAETNPTRALALFKKNPQQFDLLITDTTMPGMRGDSLAKEAMKIKPTLPVILCTGYSEQVCSEEAQQIGIKAFLMKPVATHEMAQTIRRVLGAVNRQESPIWTKRVMIVSDEDRVRTLFRQMLKSEGFKVAEAPDCKVALWIAKERPVDLLITDLNILEEKEFKTITELKCDFPQLKIITIVGSDGDHANANLEAAKNFGADIALLKPCEEEDLLQKIKDLLLN